jgi:hypothetical protein
MATLVRCIEGHAFDRAASETCPICGSTVWKTELVVENKTPRNLKATKEAAVGIGYVVASIVFIGVTINIAHDIWTSHFVKAVTKNVEEHTRPPPPPRTDEEIRKSILKKLGADNSTASQPTKEKEIPNPFVSPEPHNPFDPKIRFQSDSK